MHDGLTSLGPNIAITAPSVAATVENLTPMLTAPRAGPAQSRSASTTGRRRRRAGADARGLAQRLDAGRPPRAARSRPIHGPGDPGERPGDGVSPPLTFTVASPRAVPPATGGSGASQQQSAGDKDNDGIPDDQDTSDGSLPPVPGKTFDARVVSGNVFIKYPAGTGPRAVMPPKGFVPLKGAANVPMGAQLDTRKGRVAVTSAADTGAVKTQTADFYDGLFQVKQAVPKKKPKKPAALITNMVLKGEPSRSAARR